MEDEIKLNSIFEIVEDIINDRLIIFPCYERIPANARVDNKNTVPVSGTVLQVIEKDPQYKVIRKLLYYNPLYELFNSLQYDISKDIALKIIDKIAPSNSYIQRKLTDEELLIRIRRYYNPQRTQEDISNGILAKRKSALFRCIACWPHCYETSVALEMIQDEDVYKIAKSLIYS